MKSKPQIDSFEARLGQTAEYRIDIVIDARHGFMRSNEVYEDTKVMSGNNSGTGESRQQANGIYPGRKGEFFIGRFAWMQ